MEIICYTCCCCLRPLSVRCVWHASSARCCSGRKPTAPVRTLRVRHCQPLAPVDGAIPSPRTVSRAVTSRRPATGCAGSDPSDARSRPAVRVPAQDGQSVRGREEKNKSRETRLASVCLQTHTGGRNEIGDKLKVHDSIGVCVMATQQKHYLAQTCECIHYFLNTIFMHRLHEMKDPRTVGPPQCPVGWVARVTY